MQGDELVHGWEGILATIATYPGPAAFFFYKAFGPATSISINSRSMISIGSPLPGFKPSQDRCAILQLRAWLGFEID